MHLQKCIKIIHGNSCLRSERRLSFCHCSVVGRLLSVGFSVSVFMRPAEVTPRLARLSRQPQIVEFPPGRDKDTVRSGENVEQDGGAMVK